MKFMKCKLGHYFVQSSTKNSERSNVREEKGCCRSVGACAQTNYKFRFRRYDNALKRMKSSGQQKMTTHNNTQRSFYRETLCKKGNAPSTNETHECGVF